MGTVGAGLVFVGGQMPRDMATGRIVEGVEAQTRLSLHFCMKSLRAAGAKPENVLLENV